MKKKIRNEQKGLLFIAFILLISVVLVLIFSFALKTDAVSEELSKNSNLKTLFIIEDEDSEVLFSSVMIYYPESYKAALINLPGHTGAIWQSLNRVDKLKKVYSEAGVDAYKNEVEKLLGVKIPFYIILGFDDFIKLSDYLGGMRVFISEPVDYVSEDGQRWLLPSGAINLDGDKIAVYLHYRLADETEYDVQDRFQNCMTAFLSGIHDKKYEIFLNDDNFKIYGDCFTSNLSKDEEKSLLKLMADVDSESIIRQTITGSLRRVDDQILLFPDNNGEFIKEAVRQTVSILNSTADSMTSRVYVIEIQNGTTVQGLARNTAILFQNASYDVLSPVNANRNDYEETVIINHIGDETVAKLVGEFIHCTNIREPTAEEKSSDFASEANVDFTIILGKDFDGRYVH